MVQAIRRWVKRNLGEAASRVSGKDEFALGTILRAMVADRADLVFRSEHEAKDFAGVTNSDDTGIIPGALAVVNSITFNCAGVLKAKAGSATAVVWDLAAETDPVTALANATVAGKIKNTAILTYSVVNGKGKSVFYTKAITDNLWNLAAEIDTDGTHFRAYWLLLDAAGAATFLASTNELSAALAIAALPAVPEGKCAVGRFVAGVSTDFNNAGGLEAQGTLVEVKHRAYWLLLAANGDGSFAASPDQRTLAEAVDRLPALDGTKAVVGYFVAGPGMDYNNAGGVTGQGTLVHGWSAPLVSSVSLE